MNWLLFAAGSLVTFRLALMVSQEDGPGRIFKRIRNWPKPGSATRYGLSCPWCVGVYASALVATGFWWLEFIPGVEWPLWWLAMAAGGIVVHQLAIADRD